MGSERNDEAFEGMRQIETLLRPLMELLRIQDQERAAVAEKTNKILQEQIDQAPGPFSQKINEIIEKYQQEIEKQLSTLKENEHEGLANDIREGFEELKNSLLEQAENAVSPKNVERIANDIASIGQIKAQLERDNMSKDYQFSREKTSDIFEKSSIKKSIQLGSKNVSKECFSLGGSLAERFSAAKAEAVKFNAARPVQAIEKSMAKSIGQAVSR